MKPLNKNSCKTWKERLISAVLQERRRDRISHWLMDHAAECPHCRRRLKGVGRMELAMMMLKNQPHRMDLLTRANIQTIGMLKHDARECSHAEHLRHLFPQPTFWSRMGRFSHSVQAAAACLLVMVLLRMGIFHSMESARDEGRQAMRNYYARNLDEQTLRDLFDA